MKKKLLSVLMCVMLLCTCVFALASCGGDEPPAPKYYTITWQNYDGSVLETDAEVAESVIPTYDGTTPTKTADAQYTYEFSGWDKEISAATGDAVYTAKFNAILNSYTVTWENWDASVLEVDKSVDYGTMPTYDGETPTKQADAQYTYTFSGWDSNIDAVRGDITYTAQFSNVTNTYKVTWENWDSSVLEVDESVEYGTMPTYDGETPTRPANAQYSYTFSGWEPTIDAVTGNVTYVAQYSYVVNQYTITWQNWDGTVLEVDENVKYGVMPTYDGTTPTKSGDAQYSYAFIGWTPVVDVVTGDAIYVAQFSDSINKYNVTWQNWDGTVLELDEDVEYGATPTYDGETPTKQADVQYTYTFSGWEPAIDAVTGSTTYVAQYSYIVNKYTVTWANWDGTILKTDEIEYGTTPSYDGETPLKERTAQYSYTFSGWNPTVDTVTGDVTYSAVFSYETNKYTVTWQNWDGSVLEVDEYVNFGDLPTYDGPVPTKEKNAEYLFEFTDWDKEVIIVTGDEVYTACYQEIIRTDFYITYNANGGEGTFTYQIIKAGETITLLSDIPTLSNYRFVGWNNIYENKVYQPGDSFSLVKDVELCAMWELICSNCAGKGTIETRTDCSATGCFGGYITTYYYYCYNCSSLDMDEVLRYCTKCEHLVNTYYMDKLYCTYCRDNTSTKAVCRWCDGNVYLRSSSKKCTSCNGTGYFSTFSDCYSCVDGVIVDSAPSLYDAGFNFVELVAIEGYQYSMDGIVWQDSHIFNGLRSSTTYTFYQRIATKNDVPFGNTSLPLTITTAAAPQYIISYDLDGGTSTNPKTYTVESDKIVLEAPTKSGYTFIGWTGSNGTEPNVEVVILAGSTGNLNYTAHWSLNSYTISYDLDGGVIETPNKDSYTVLDDDFVLLSPTKEHYDFLGWAYNGNVLSKIDTSSVQNYQLVATWAPHEYIITYNLNGGTSANPETYTVEFNGIVLAAPTKVGYTFVGWTYEGQDTPALEVTISQGSSGNKEFIAHWTPNTYTIKLDPNGGDVENDTIKVTYDKSYDLPEMTRTGYNFEGWFSETTEFTSGIWNYDADVTLKAKWTVNEYVVTYLGVKNTVKITYDYNYSGSTPTVITLGEYGGLSRPRDPVRVEYVFSGWYLDSACTKRYDFTGSIFDDMTLYAGWTTRNMDSANATFIYAWDYESSEYYFCQSTSGTSSSKKNYIYVVAEETGTHGICWRNSSSASSYGYYLQIRNVTTGETIRSSTLTYSNSYTTETFTCSAGDVIEIGFYRYNTSYSSNAYFYFTGFGYQPNVRADVDLQNGYIYNDNYSYAENVTYGENYTLSIPIRAGYTFLGWYNGDTLVESGPWNITTDVILTPRWQANSYEITLDGNGIELSTTSIPVTYNEEFTLPTLTRPGYTFLGWYNGDDLVESGIWETESDVTLVAKWEANKYQIKYTLDGGTNNKNNPSYYTVNDEITLVAPTKPGYVFTGWTGSNGDVPKLSVSFSGTGLCDLEYTANWELGVYTVDYVLNGGTNPSKNPTAITMLDEFKLVDATRTGYTFKGWYIDAEFTSSISSLTNVTSNITLYARFVPNQYSATFISDPVDEKITITLNHGEGVNKVTYHTITRGSSFNPYEHIVSHNNYVFGGWYLDSNFTRRVPENVVLYSDTTLYAMRVYCPKLYDKLPVKNSTIKVSSYDVTYYIPDNVCQIYVKSVAYDGSSASVTIWHTYSYGYEYLTSSVSPTGSEMNVVEGYFTVYPGDELIFHNYKGDGYAYSEVMVTKTYSGAVTYGPYSASKTISYDSEMPISSILGRGCTTDRLGYKFVGWIDEDGVMCGETWNFLENKTFTAKWELIEYTIKYNLDGGTNSSYNPGHYNITKTITLKNPTKAGYTFKGWYTDSGFKNKITSISNKTGNYTLYAKFEANTYTGSLNLDGGIIAPQVTFVSDGEVVDSYYLTSDIGMESYYPPAKEGYIFGGWYTDESCQTAFSFSKVIKDDITLYAKWISSDTECHQITTNDVETESIVVNGTNEIKITFVPLASGKITITTSSQLDVKGILYNESMVNVAEADDISDENYNFSITYSVEAGKQYTIAIKGATTLTKGECDVLFSFDGNMGISGTTYTSFDFDVIYDSLFELPIPTKEGYEFLGWFDSDGNAVTSSNWNYAQDTTLYARWVLID